MVDGDRAARVVRTLLQQPLLPTRQWYNDSLLQQRRGEWEPSLLETAEALEILQRATAALKTEPNVLELTAPVMIVGDIHGHFADLLELMRRVEGLASYDFVEGGRALKQSYLFMGDYVDRGSYGVEVVLFLLALKLAQPDRVHMLRGNHETRSQTMRPMKTEDDEGRPVPEHLVGIHFKREAEIKYGRDFYKNAMLCFDALPLAAVLHYDTSRFLCIHGGLSPSMRDLSALREINRFREPELSGVLCDILWSDPISRDLEDEAWDGDKYNHVEYVPNWDRGGGHFFGIAAVKKFLKENKLDGIIRAHQMEDGVFYHFRDDEFKYPLVTTVFSASNYCGHDENRAGVIEFHESSIRVLLLDPALEEIASVVPFGNTLLPEPRRKQSDEAMPPTSPRRASLQRRRSIVVDFGLTVEGYASGSGSSASLHNMGERERSSSAESHASWDTLRRVASLKLEPHVLEEMMTLAVRGHEQSPSRRPSQTDLSAASQELSLSMSDLGQLGVLFEAIDHNGDGVLQVDELKAFMVNLYEMYDEPSTRALFDVIDRNHDGIIEFAEFAAFFANLQFKQQTPV